MILTSRVSSVTLWSRSPSSFLSFLMVLAMSRLLFPSASRLSILRIRSLRDAISSCLEFRARVSSVFWWFSLWFRTLRARTSSFRPWMVRSRSCSSLFPSSISCSMEIFFSIFSSSWSSSRSSSFVRTAIFSSSIRSSLRLSSRYLRMSASRLRCLARARSRLASWASFIRSTSASCCFPNASSRLCCSSCSWCRSSRLVDRSCRSFVDPCPPSLPPPFSRAS